MYAHYLHKGELRKTVRMARNPNKCGEWRKKARQIPVRNPGKGIWTVQFDQLKQYEPVRPNFPSFVGAPAVHRQQGPRLTQRHATAGVGSAARARSNRSSPSAASTRTMSPAA